MLRWWELSHGAIQGRAVPEGLLTPSLMSTARNRDAPIPKRVYFKSAVLARCAEFRALRARREVAAPPSQHLTKALALGRFLAIYEVFRLPEVDPRTPNLISSFFQTRPHTSEEIDGQDAANLCALKPHSPGMPRHLEGRARRLTRHPINPDMVRRSARLQGPGERPSSAPAETASRGRGPSQPDPASTGNSGASSSPPTDADSRKVFALGMSMRTKEEKRVIAAARQHFDEHKWVVFEGFVTEEFVQAMLEAERDVREFTSERVETLDFNHDGVSSKREMIQHRFRDTPKSCLELVDLRLERIGFYRRANRDLTRKWSHVRFRPTILVSHPGAPRQHIHSDFKDAGPGDADGSDADIVPYHFGVLIALQEGTRLLHGVTGEEIEVPPRGAIIFRGDFPHAGASYAKRNVRLHVYFIRGVDDLPKDPDGNLVVYLEKELEAKQRERESAAQRDRRSRAGLRPQKKAKNQQH